MRFRSTKHLYWYIAGAFLIAALHFFGVLTSFERSVRVIADKPITFFFGRMQRASFLLHEWRDTQHAADVLPETIRDRDLLKTRIALVEAENAALRRELQYPERKQWLTIGAEVISKTTDIARQVLIINRGGDDGIKEHQIVFSEQGVLVGEIISAERSRATVRLINDRESRVGVLLAKNSHASGIVEGGYGLGLRLNLIPPQEVVEQGDTVVTNDTSEFMPRGLIIGRAVAVGREIYEPFQHALIESAIAFDEIHHVSIILNK